ncbi:MFS transporter [Mixta tenebrionis]|jgi:MHS family shikimate/dehydroshikimate transporter-like MFS transporter|uniref:MHS family MFS transporter n=1 Tax=Mixta tenebrionis TaxID=2562439 RepID=A0A506VDW1_9GAMM|nr:MULTISPECIES: MFS transporter [Mixta]QHM76897.1 Inner membrane metabolite transport protein YhjE [Mixta theicola]TPW43702.1 MHS family MFS transporter [Mixta tenebrionis]
MTMLTSPAITPAENEPLSLHKQERRKLITVLGSGLSGTTIEFYDFFIYGTAAALVFPALFFPNLSPLMALLVSFLTLSITFVSRPIGAIVFGHYGDKIGRKKSLVLSLMIMGISTFLIGLIPSYHAIGNAAPLILIFLRLCQGFAIGGEWGGATTLITEYAPRNRRGFFGTFVQLGNVLGLFIATAVFALVVMLPEKDLMSWGWRVPFLLSIALLFVGMFIRSRIEETPVFKQNQQRQAAQSVTQKFPVLTVLKHHRKAVFLAMGMRMGEIVLGWLTVAFFMSYVTRELNFTRETALNGLLLASFVGIFTFPFFGWLSDKIGRRPVYLAGAAITLIFAFPLFWMIDSGSVKMFMFATTFCYSVGLGMMFSVQPAFFSELFDTSVRYTGVSLGFQLANIVGGLTPMIATLLIAWSGGASWPISLFLACMALVTILCVCMTRESYNDELNALKK